MLLLKCKVWTTTFNFNHSHANWPKNQSKKEEWIGEKYGFSRYLLAVFKGLSSSSAISSTHDVWNVP